MKKHGRTSIITISELIICFLAALACIMTGNYVNEGYDVAVGKVSAAKIVAPRQIENVYATEKKKLEAATGVTPLYKLDQDVSERVRDNIAAFFSELENRKAAADILEGVNSDEEDEAVSVEETPEETDNSEIVASTILISAQQFENYRQLPRATRIELRDTLLSIAETIMGSGIKDEADTKSLLYARDELNRKLWPSEIVNLGYYAVTSVLEPNLVVDEEATTAAMETKVAQVQPVIILEGQKIVDEGDIITDEAYWLLSELDLVSENKKGNYFEILGPAAIVLAIFMVFTAYVRLYYKKMASKRNETTLLCILYLAAIIMMRLMSHITFYIIPLTVPIILVAVLTEQRLAILLNVLIVFLCSLIYKGSVEFLLYFIITGTVAVLISGFTFERTKIVIAGIITCAVNLLIVTGINIFYYKSLDAELMFNAVIAVSNGLLSLLIAIGCLPIWEAVFDLITPVKLLDLTNPNNPLLRRLTIEAPGTYHHSLIVANLAEQAAHDIGANAPLARVGGYYHDIGKLKYPYYFGENQVGENPHDQFDPYDSARLIMQHVPLGLEYADTYKLPRPIKDIIYQHHGTTLVKFFFHKAQEAYSVDHVKESDFRYNGNIPNGKEAAIVMLADTAEAAVRSMVTSSKSMPEVEAFLHTLVKSKLDDSQLDDSQLTLTEMKVIIKAFMKIFRGMYHERVKYPGESEKASTEETKETEVSSK